MTIFTEVLIIAVLLLINGIFAMSELAVVAARRVRLQARADAGDRGATVALELASDPGSFLSTVQVGITLVGVIASAYGGATLAERLGERLELVAWIGEHGHAVALAIVVAGITTVSVILGELVPKRIALGSPERVASLVARPMRTLAWLGTPLVRFLTGSTQLILGIFGVRGSPEPGLTEEEIQAIIEQGAASGVVAPAEHAILENVFRLGDRHVASIMTARPDVEWLDVSATADQLTQALRDGRDWVLVCEGDIDHVLGTVHASDLLMRCMDGQRPDLAGAIRPALIIPTFTPVFQLLDALRREKRDVAVVLDEYGGISGVASLDNIMAALIGTTDSSVDTPRIEADPAGGWVMDGHADIRDVEEALELPPLDSRERRGYRTLAGYILTRLGRVPKEGETVSAGAVTFRVVGMDGRRVARVSVTKEPAGARED